MIARMKKVILVGPKALTRSAIQTLQEVGTVHLTQSEGVEKIAVDEKGTQELSDKEKLHAKVDSVLAILPTPSDKSLRTLHHTTGGQANSQLPTNSTLPTPNSQLPTDIEPWLTELSQKCQDLTQKKQMLSDEYAVLQAYQEAAKVLAPLLEPLQDSKNFEAVGFIVSRKDAHRTEQMEGELLKLFTDQVLIFKRSIDKETLGLVLAYSRTQAAPIRSSLNRYGLNELKIPSSLAGYPLQEAVQKMEERAREIPQELLQVENELGGLAQSHRKSLEFHRVQLEDEIISLKAVKELGQTQKTFIITGYNPQKRIQQLFQMIEDRFQGSVHLEVQDCKEAPTLLDNRRWVKPFELFIKILQPPKYGSIDPTPFFALFFPIFFGLIMGDIGYGTIFLILGLFLRLKTTSEALKSVAEIILICSTYTIIFGFVFGECFGDWLEKMGVLHPLKMTIGSIEIEWNRMHSLLPLLILSIGIGVFHVTLGFILKLIQSLKHRHVHEAVEVIAILVALAGLFTLIGVLAQQIPALAKIPSVIALLVAVPLLIYMKGPLMLIELLSFIGNMLSYARLMAVGVASAYLAFVGNMMGGLVGNVVLGAMIAILFHIINMVLAFSPTIQSARLHYVEFFTKFYESGGRIYQPLRKKLKA